MPDYSSEWETETGLAQEYDLIIDKAFFGFDARYQDGETLLLHWEGRAFEPNSGKYDAPMLISTEDGNHVHIMMPCGADWTTPDDGATAEKPGHTAFNQRSIYGMVIQEIKTGAVEGGNVLLGRGGPRKAAIWNGVKVHLKNREITYKGLGTTNRLMPVKVYGIEGEAKGSTTAAPATATAKMGGDAGTATGGVATATATDEVSAKRQALLDKARKAKEKSAATAAGGNGKPAYVVQLETLAKESANHEAFITPALQIEELLLDDALANNVVDDGPTGFYATHH